MKAMTKLQINTVIIIIITKELNIHKGQEVYYAHQVTEDEGRVDNVINKRHGIAFIILIYLYISLSCV